MQSSKIRLGIIFGGKSAEHEISIRSAANVVRAVDPAKYDLVFFGIDRRGGWQRASVEMLQSSEVPVGNGGKEYPAVTLAEVLPELGSCDAIFPVLHGPCGEDGTVQGLLRLIDVPFVGADVLGSAVGMDKCVMKRLLTEAGIPIGRYSSFRNKNEALEAYAQVTARLGSTLYVKPSAQGSSIGVSRAQSQEEYKAAVIDAFQYDDVILVEEAIAGREIECAVLGDLEVITSVCGEIIPRDGFYSYENKYIDENGAAFEKPARISREVSDRMRKMAMDTFLALDCSGLARVDFFLKQDGSILVNEINTLPGFTSISMYPQLFELSGVRTNELLDRLVSIARARHSRKQAHKIDRRAGVS
ncbi:MAG: D-alanine--D-alanine ligase [Leptospirales bacterium]|nr:D-alanine--D-alanine ligase [Leptospirales bacterium]